MYKKVVSLMICVLLLFTLSISSSANNSVEVRNAPKLLSSEIVLVDGESGLIYMKTKVSL